MTVSGSQQTSQIDGVTYDVKSEADLTENSGQEVEGIATSGTTLYKAVKKVPTRESQELIVDSVDKQRLEDLADFKITPGTYAISYTEADGTVNSGQGRINIDSRTTQENTMTVTYIPKTKFDVFPV